MTVPARPRQPPIAVVGVGAITAGAHDAQEFWRTVLAGRDMITDVPESHWSPDDYYDPDPGAQDRTYGRRGAFLEPVEFDPLAYGIPPAALPATDTTQLLALQVAEQVLADAGVLHGRELDRERVSVILGSAALELLHSMSNRMQRPAWLRALRASGIPEEEAQRICDRIAANYAPWQEATFPGLLSNVVAGRIANRFDLHGSNYTTDAACAGSLAALSGAVSELAMGTADLVVTGGVDTLNDIVMFMCFSKTPALSKSGDCRPFSADADGTMLGEALVMVALKRLEDAERDGDRIYAVIRGIGSSSDGRGSAIYTPVPEGQARALRRAYEAAGYGPDTVGLVEAHGTGTAAGDAAEFSGLRTVFEEPGRVDRQWCALGSVKSQIGHTKSAAGAAGLLKAVLALQHKVLPPTIKVDRPNPALDLPGSPFYLNTRPRPWINGSAHPRRASVSSFGFGGTNFHVTLEEYMPTGATSAHEAPLTESAPTQLVLLGAGSAAEILERARTVVTEAGQSLAAAARRTQRAFDPASPVRLCLVAQDAVDLGKQVTGLESLLREGQLRAITTPDGLSFDPNPRDPGRVALLFSGQGSQYLDMGADLATHLPPAREAWDRAARTPFGDRPLDRVVFPPPAFTEDERATQQALLTRTDWAQPALAVQSVAQLSVLRALGLEPDCVAGHSFGELVALHAAGVFDEQALLRLARKRGELMSEGAPGAMLAVRAGQEEAERLIEDFAGRIWLANINSPRQVVLSGHAEAITQLEARLREEGRAVRRLQASGAFHTPLIEDAHGPFLEELAAGEIHGPLIDVYGNVDAAPYPAEPGAIRHRLAGQLLSPVRFADEILSMYEAGARTFVEVGAGSVLSRLVGDTLDDRPHLAVSLDRKGTHGITALQRAMGRLAVAGIPLDLEPLWHPYHTSTVDHEDERRRPAMSVRISGSNYGKPGPIEPERVRGEHPQAAPAASLNPAAVATPEVIPPVAPATVPATTGSPVEEVLRQAADAHTEYQRVMAETHLAYLRLAENSLRTLADAPLEEPAYAEEARTAPAVRNPAVPAPPSFAVPAPTPALVPAEMVAVSPVAQATPLADSGSGVDVGDVLVEVVAEKTGYPREILEPHLELESDLGIDSIKRVEILSVLRKRVPGVTEVDPAEFAQLRTLGEITARYSAVTTNAPAVPQSVPTGDTQVADVGDVLVEVVAEKTGYPREILEPHLELESDLGIDSIKRVEILSVLRKRVPGVTEVDPAEFAQLRTLGEITARYSAMASDVPRPVSVDLVRTVSVMRPQPAPGLELPGLRKGPVAVVDGGAGIAELVAGKLRERGIDAGAVASGGSEAATLILLGGMRPVGSAADAVAVNREVFGAVRRVAAKFAERGGSLVVVQDTGGDFGLHGAGDRAWLGGLAGLARCAAKEWPRGCAKTVDCERGDRSPDELADVVVAELAGGGATSDIGLRADGTRWALGEEPAAAEPSAATVHSGSVIVATGGARGVTAAGLVALAGAHRPTLVVLGRTELTEEQPELAGVTDERELRQRIAARPAPPGSAQRGPAEIAAEARHLLAVREIRATLAALESAGSVARYLAVDVRDAAAVRAALDRVRAEFGPVTGLVHGAGVLADFRLEDKTAEQFDAVFDTKVASLDALLAATESDPLDLVCVYSSVAGRFGNAGQSDYAMANEVLAQVASEVAARKPRSVVRSLAWGPWDGGMVGPELRERILGVGVKLIPPAAGGAAFVRDLAAGPGPVRVTIAAGDRPDALGDDPSPAPVGVAVLHSDSHPYLDDHVIDGTPVLPLALVLDWFTGVAGALIPSADDVVLRDLEVLRGVALPDLAGTGHHLVVTAAHDLGADGRRCLRLSLIGEGGRVHYRATAGRADSLAPVRDWSPPAGLSPVPAAAGYGGRVLFHGPAFHALAEPAGCAEAGAVAPLSGVLDLKGWPSEGWHTDPAAVDAGLQLALVWAAEACDAVCLPMAIGAVRVHRRGPVGGLVRGVVRAVERDRLRPVCDIALLGPDGAVLAELLGVTLVRRPEGRG